MSKAKYRHQYQCRIACFDDEDNDVACEWEGMGGDGGMVRGCSGRQMVSSNNTVKKKYLKE